MIRKYFKHPAITTDVIVGFPGETEEEFEITREYLEKIHFYEMHIFKYSKRQGTRAAVMPDQIPEPVKSERSNILIGLGEKMSEEFRQYYIGKTEEVLLEEQIEIDGKKYFSGFTKEYVKVAVAEGGHHSNQMIKGKIKEQLTEELYLMVEI